MPFCIFCGKEVEESARFCAFCGRENTIPDKPKAVTENANQITEQWHYNDSGVRKGPLSRQDIERFIQAGKITAATSVWNGEGDWNPAGETNLSGYFMKPITDNPPALPGKDVSNIFVWCVVAVPIVGTIIELMIEKEFVWIYWIANIFFCILDERKLKAAGHEAPNTWWAILIPVYLWKRASMLKQKRFYFWGWVAAFALSIFIAAGAQQNALEEAAVPVVSQILQESLGSDAAICKSVSIDKEVTTGFYKATATLDNGNEIQITIEEQDNNQIMVRIPPQ